MRADEGRERSNPYTYPPIVLLYIRPTHSVILVLRFIITEEESLNPHDQRPGTLFRRCVRPAFETPLTPFPWTDGHEHCFMCPGRTGILKFIFAHMTPPFHKTAPFGTAPIPPTRCGHTIPFNENWTMVDGGSRNGLIV